MKKERMILGLCGEAGAGKDTAGLVLAQLGFAQVAFADPIRELLRRMNPLIVLAGGVVPIRYQTLLDEKGYDWAKRNVPEVRRLLQQLGDGARNVIHENCWTYVAKQKLVNPNNTRNYVSDVRYPGNEPALIRELGGYIIRIERPGHGGDANIDKSHPSERDVNQIVADITIINNEGELEKFKADVASAARTLFGHGLYETQAIQEF